MPKDTETSYTHMFTSAGYQSLRTYLGNVAKGQPKVYDTPFAKGESTEDLLSAWNDVLVSISNKWPSLYEFEIDLAKKVGPLSVQLPLKDRLADVAHYYEDIHLPSTAIDERAVKAVCREFSGLRGLRRRSYENTVAKMKTSTNSGAPYFTKRRQTIDRTLPITGYGASYAYDERVWPVVAQHGKEWMLPAVIGWRGQEAGPSKSDVKQRVVWMFPFGVNIIELSIYQPFIEAAQKLNVVPAWVSMESVDKRVTDLFDTKGRNDLVVCTDFSRFDQHFNATLQQCAKTIMRYVLDRQFSPWLGDVFDMKYYIPLVLNSDKKGTLTSYVGPHGMASGSGGTNVDETLTHRALQYEAAILAKSRLNPNSQCLGDDGILSYPGITVEDVVKAYERHGQECNPDKQYASTQDCVYLRRWHHTDYRDGGICVGVYSTMRALGRLRYLERFMDPKYWGPKMVALRQLSILENVKYHPLKEQFVQFCMKRDKYRLGIDIPGFLDSVDILAKESIEHMPDFLGYTKTLQSQGKALGLSDWWIVKFLKSM